MNEEEKVSPKTFWKTIKSIFPTKSTKHSNEALTRAQGFSDYFSSIVGKLKSKSLPLRDSVWYFCRRKPLRTKCIFKFSCITSGYVLKHLNRLKRNKATDIDQLPPNMLKDCSEEISGPLASIINLSLNTHTVLTLLSLIHI